jgi:hypothetical protein
VFIYKKSLSNIALAAFWRSAICFSVPRRTFYVVLFLAESFHQKLSIKPVYPNNPKIKPQAQPGVIFPLFIETALMVTTLVKVDGSKTKQK